MRLGITAAFLLAGSSYFALGFAPTLWLAILAVAAGHAGTSLAWVFSTTMLQSMTEDQFRGRVFSADFSGLFLMMSGVSLFSSQAVDLGVSIRTIAMCTGVLSLVPALGWSWCQRYWRNPGSTIEFHGKA